MAAPARALVLGCAGLGLTAAERALFAGAPPFGLILFARNIDNPLQVMELTAEFRACVGRASAPVFIDQEGGRVARLGPPHWPSFPSAGAIGRLYNKDRTEGLAAAKLLGRRMGEMLRPLGITVNCAPVADLLADGATAAIGDRAFSRNPAAISQLAQAVCDGLMTAGVFPVVKHLPGHGRARVDSHDALPVVDVDAATLRETDFVPFTALAGQPFAMTAHVLYPALDPDHCATLSKKIIAKVIRKQFGFGGLLISDDLAMGALQGEPVARMRGALTAGCDVALYCKPDFPVMDALATAAPPLSEEADARWQTARKTLRPARLYDPCLARAEFDRLMSRVPAEA